MVTATQSELKHLLTNQLTLAHTKVITALIGATLAATITPLHKWDIPQIKAKHENEIINLIALITGCGLCGYAYVASGKVREYGGKLEMFHQLEKERFIEEQLQAQAQYFAQLRYQQQWQNYQEQNQYLTVDVPSVSPQSVSQSEPTDKSEPDQQRYLQPSVSQSVVSQSGLTCPRCQSINTQKNGTRANRQKGICKDCGTNFTI